MSPTLAADRRRVAIATLVLMSIGAAIPWGLSTGAHESSIHTIEWALSMLHLAVAVALIVSWGWPRFRRLGDESLVASAGAWAATSVLLGWLLPGATIGARFGLGLMFIGPAVLAAGTYSVERRGQSHGQ